MAVTISICVQVLNLGQEIFLNNQRHEGSLIATRQLFLNFIITIAQVIVNMEHMNDLQNTGPVPRLENDMYPDNNGPQRNGKDVYNELMNDPRLFWQLSGETVESFDLLHDQLQEELLHAGVEGSRWSRSRLSTQNRLLLSLIWIRMYPTYNELKYIFNLDSTVICREINCTLPVILAGLYDEQITWPDNGNWEEMRGSLQDPLNNVVAMIDGFSMRIQRPFAGDLQRLYYSGHRKSHVIHTQAIVDTNNDFVFSQPGFMGHLPDQATFNMIPVTKLSSPCPRAVKF